MIRFLFESEFASFRRNANTEDIYESAVLVILISILGWRFNRKN